MDTSQIIAADFSTYIDWFETSLDLIWRLSPDLKAKYDPMAAVRNIKGEPSKRHIKSLSNAVRDTVSMTDRYSHAELNSADMAFAERGLPTLTSMKMIFSKEFVKILNMEQIDDENNCFIAKSVEDLDVPDFVKDRVRKLYGDFELKRFDA